MGKDFEFIVERDKVDKIKRVIARNEGEVVGETPVQEDVRIKVRKVRSGEES